MKPERRQKQHIAGVKREFRVMFVAEDLFAFAVSHPEIGERIEIDRRFRGDERPLPSPRCLHVEHTDHIGIVMPARQIAFLMHPDPHDLRARIDFG